MYNIKRKELIIMGGRGSSSGKTVGARGNTYKSEFGLKNVGKLQEFRTFGGSTMVGTVTPSANDVQEYFKTGKFDNYGTNARAKKLIVDKIIKDMHNRGYDVTLSEDKTKLLPNGDTSKAISISNTKNGWRAKQAKSGGNVSRSGMKGALDRTQGRR